MRERLTTVGSYFAAHRRTVAISVAAGIVLVVIAAILVFAPRRGHDQVDSHGYDRAVVAITDIPARAFIGWQQVDAGPRPTPSTTPDGMHASNPDCIPGGRMQRDAEQLVLAGDTWGAAQFVNPGFAHTMTVAVSNSPNTDVTVLDHWLDTCADTTVTGTDSGEQHMVLSSLPVEPAFYRLDVARVYAQAVTDAQGHTTTALTAYGQADGITIQVRYTFPGPVTDDAIQQLDVVWRAQAAKLVGMQDAGEL